MKTEPGPEIVEILDEDAESFRGQPPAPPHRMPVIGSRWFGPAVAGVLLALAGYVVVSSSIESNPSSPATPGDIAPQYYVADPVPAAFNMYMAEARGETGSNPADFAPKGEAEMWATPDASATTGSWFVVTRGPQHATGRNSNRMIVDGNEVVFEHDPASGQTRLSFTKNGNEMSITAFGWIDRQLVRLVKSVNVDDQSIRFSDGFFTADHQRVLQADPMSALFGAPVARVGYTTGLPLALADHFTVTVAGDNVEHESEVAKFALTNAVSFTVGDLPAIVGLSAADPTTSIAQWKDGDRLITVEGNIDPARMVATASAVHASRSDAVHRQLAEQSPASLDPGPAGEKTVVSGMLADGVPWVIQVDRRTDDPTDSGYTWWIGQPDGTREPWQTRPRGPDDGPTIDTFVEHGRTYVLASIPRSMDGAELHVAPTGLPSIVTRLHDVDATLPGEFAASVFLQPVPFTARIIDANGTTVAFWPTFGRAAS